MNPREVHRATTLVLSAAVAAIGVALIVKGAAAGGGVDYTRLVLGVLFVAAGTARLYVQLHRGRGD